MARSYGASHLITSEFSEFPIGVFAPAVFPERGKRKLRLLGRSAAEQGVADVSRGTAIVKNLPAVKDQGELPVCSAVVSLTLYEQLLLREGLMALPTAQGFLFKSPVELGWAWVYLSGRRLLETKAAAQPHFGNHAQVREQLLSGLPLRLALQGLIEGGILTASDGLYLNDPMRLQEQLAELQHSPRGMLVAPLRVLSVLPTVEALYDVVSSQYAVGFAFAIDPTIDAWMHSASAQEETEYELPAPPEGSPRLATHAAVITAVDVKARKVTVQNSFGSTFGIMGFFFVPFGLLLRSDFSGLQFFVLLRAT